MQECPPHNNSLTQPNPTWLDQATRLFLLFFSSPLFLLLPRLDSSLFFASTHAPALSFPSFLLFHRFSVFSVSSVSSVFSFFPTTSSSRIERICRPLDIAVFPFPGCHRHIRSPRDTDPEPSSLPTTAIACLDRHLVQRKRTVVPSSAACASACVHSRTKRKGRHPPPRFAVLALFSFNRLFFFLRK